MKGKSAGDVSLAAGEPEVKATRELAGRLLLAREELGRKIGQELHDTVGQSLTLLGMSLSKLRKLPPDKIGPELDTADALVREVVQQVRDVSRTLGMYMLPDLGLEEALRSHFQNIWSRAGVKVNFQRQGLERRLPEVLEVTLFRIIQEAITNVCRHAGTSEVDVSIEAGDGAVALRIEDMGVGFDPAAVPPDSPGLRGMRERAAFLGGRLRVDSSPGEGTIINADFPLA